MAKVETFVFGKQKAPEWFNEYCRIGRAKVNYDDENDNEMTAKLHTPTGILNAKVGDTIINTRAGLGIVPEDKAKKYGVQKNEKSDKKVDSEGIQQKVDE